MLETKEIPSIYALKALSAVLIILLHSGALFGSSIIYNLLWPVFRISVPIFFIISGFFFCTESLYGFITHAHKSIIKLLKIGVVSFLLFSIYSLLTQGGNFILTKLEDPTTYALFIIRNKLPYGDHLWYIFAYAYLLFFSEIFFKCRRGIKVSLGGVVFVVMISYTLVCIFCLFFLRPEIVTCNWIVIGLPNFFIGWIIKRDYFKTLSSSSHVVFAIVVVFLLALTIIENATVPVKMGDLYFTTIPLSLFVFLFFCTNKIDSFILYVIGKRHSMWIYITHIMGLGIVKHLFMKLEIGAGFITGIAGVAIILFISIIMSEIFRYIFKL